MPWAGALSPVSLSTNTHRLDPGKRNRRRCVFRFPPWEFPALIGKPHVTPEEDHSKGKMPKPVSTMTLLIRGIYSWLRLIHFFRASIDWGRPRKSLIRSFAERAPPGSRTALRYFMAAGPSRRFFGSKAENR